MSKNQSVNHLIEKFDHPLKTILLFGPPGSGKGTLGKFLSSAGNHVHLSSGDVFRGLSPNTSAGKLYYKYANDGHLVPDEATVAIWHNYVEGLISTHRYFPSEQILLLDGIPRTLIQAQLMDRYIDVLKIIVLETSDIDQLVRRMKRRGLIERRTDDIDEHVVRTRMKIYEEETLGLLKHYPSSKIARFNADLRPLEVLRDVLIELAGFLSK